MAGAASDRAYAEAAAWLARLCADRRDAADEEGFRTWLAASPENAAAFEAVDRNWDALGGLGEVDWNQPPRKVGIARRAILTGAGAALLGTGGFYITRPAGAQTLETGVGEQKRVTLGDGSRLFLDAQTKVTLAFSDTVRAAALAYGRTNFQVAADARPFVVEAAQRKIVAEQCNVDIRCDGEKVQVVLIRGEAAVDPKGAEPSARLRTGERMIAAAGVETFDRPRLAPLVAWQDGYAVFESTRLKEAVAEMNRYSDTRIDVDPAIADRKVSGVYRTGDNVAFARVVAQLLAVGVRQDDRTLLLGAAEKN